MGFRLQCRDTYWVESFNHQLLCYIPKRIHFSTRVFSMRMNLAVIDWVGRTYVRTHLSLHSCLQNKNVNRPCTSQRKVKDLRRPDRRTGMKVLVKKSYKFAVDVWDNYFKRNLANLE